MRPADLQRLTDAYGVVAAAETARRLGLFAELSRAAATAAELANERGLEPVATAKLLELLSSLGLLERDEHRRFATTSAVAVAEAMRFWDHLDCRLTEGTSRLEMEGPVGAGAAYPAVVGSMAEAQAPLAERASDVLAGVGREVIDVGAGAATWSLPLALREPSCHVTLVDRPEVLEVARARVAAFGCVERFAFEPGDLNAAGFGSERYDLAIVGNVCHLFGGAENTRLFSRLFGALRAGGTLAVIDSTPDDYGTAMPRHLYALSLAVRTRAGDVHSFSAYCAWMREAGFRGIERVRLDEGSPMSLIRAHKASAVEVLETTSEVGR